MARKKAKSRSKKGGTLRKRAEKLLPEKGKRIPKKVSGDAAVLIHELQVHQVELEMQNEELRRAQLELEESRNKYAELYEFAPVGYFNLDRKGRIVEVNLTGARLLGVERSSLIHKPFFRFVMPESRNQFYSCQQRVFTRPTKETCELKLRKKDGSSFDASMPCISVQDSEGKFTQCRCAITDLTERKRAEEALKAASLYTRSLIEASLDPLVTISANGKVMDVNKATELVTGVSRDDLIGSDFSEYFTEPEKAKEGYQQVFLEGSVRDYPLIIRHTSGMVTDVLYNAAVYRNETGEVQGVFAAARDITERKRAEKALRESEERLRHLYSQLVAAQENERKRVARELHDGLQQLLAGIKFKVESFVQEIRKTGIKTHTKPLEAVIPIIQESVREIRRIQMNLRPAILDDLGILATISWFCREYQATYPGIQVEKQVDIQEDDVPEPLKMVIYRILQEGLTNIAKHSRADIAYLSFRKTDGRIELSIQDNGQGFDLHEPLSAESPRRGLGLASMRERAEHSGGSFAIESEEGKGTVLRATWPM